MTATGNGKTIFTGLDVISTMLAGIKSSEYTTPGTRPGPDQHIVGEATDAIKRLATLRDQMDAKVRPLAEEQEMLQDRAKAMFSGITALSQVVAVTSSSEFVAIAKRLDDLPNEASDPVALSEIAENLLWFEVKKTFPGLVGKPAIGFNSKWQVYWTEDDARRRGRAGIDELLAALQRGGRGGGARMM